jgi:hypothetical protein
MGSTQDYLLRTNYAVFFEREYLDGLTSVSWGLQHFGFETLDAARVCFNALRQSTDHISQRSRGFRDLRLSEKRNGVWHELERFDG